MPRVRQGPSGTGALVPRRQRGAGKTRARRFRGIGLGHALISEAVTIGRSLGLGKLKGMLTPQQNAAQIVFERLAFASRPIYKIGPGSAGAPARRGDLRTRGFQRPAFPLDDNII